MYKHFHPNLLRNTLKTKKLTANVCKCGVMGLIMLACIF